MCGVRIRVGFAANSRVRPVLRFVRCGEVVVIASFCYIKYKGDLAVCGGPPATGDYARKIRKRG